MIGGGNTAYINDKAQSVDQFEDRRRREQTLSEDLSDTSEERMPSCDECGLMFENVSDLMRHVKQWCPENNDFKRKREDDNDGIPFKRSKIDVQIEDGEDIAFNKLARLAREETKDHWNEKVLR
jgi:hypothetical protein